MYVCYVYACLYIFECVNGCVCGCEGEREKREKEKIVTCRNSTLHIYTNSCVYRVLYHQANKEPH